MRKYTLEYYLKFLNEIDTPKLRVELGRFYFNVISKIQQNYKKLVKGYFIDYVSRHEDFWMITTYSIEDLVPVGICIVRSRNGKKHQQKYAKYYKSYFSNETEWRRGSLNYSSKRYCYTSNLKELFKGTEYEYSFVWELGNNIDIKIRNLLVWCSDWHISRIECLTKLRCYKFARDIMNGSGTFVSSDSNIIKAIGLKSSKQIDYIVQNNLSADDVMVYVSFLKSGIDLRYFRKFKSFLRYWDFPCFDGFSQKSFVDYYLSQVKQNLFKGVFEYFVRDYRDYLRFGEDLGYDFKDTKYFKPKNFVLSHDQAYLKYESKKNKVLDSAVKKVLKKYQCLTFEKGDYAIVVPLIADDIRLEGRNMSNCVGGYVGRVKDGKSIICFVRHSAEKDKSFYTLELNPKDLKVVQCRGYHNGTTPEESKVQKFVQYWRKNVVLKNLKRLDVV